MHNVEHEQSNTEGEAMDEDDEVVDDNETASAHPQDV